MKKFFAPIFFAAIACVTCGCSDASVQSRFTENYAEMWFDNFTEDYREQNSLELEEFPGVVFHSDGLNLTAEKNGKETVLYSGLPLWNVFLTDLTGDGLPEFCSTISVGSGFIDDRIIVCDFSAGTVYELSDRGQNDYILTLTDGVLTVRKKAYGKGWEDTENGEVTGRLAISFGELVME